MTLTALLNTIAQLRDFAEQDASQLVDALRELLRDPAARADFVGLLDNNASAWVCKDTPGLAVLLEAAARADVDGIGPIFATTIESEEAADIAVTVAAQRVRWIEVGYGELRARIAKALIARVEEWEKKGRVSATMMSYPSVTCLAGNSISPWFRERIMERDFQTAGHLALALLSWCDDARAEPPWPGIRRMRFEELEERWRRERGKEAPASPGDTLASASIIQAICAMASVDDLKRVARIIALAFGHPRWHLDDAAAVRGGRRLHQRVEQAFGGIVAAELGPESSRYLRLIEQGK